MIFSDRTLWTEHKSVSFFLNWLSGSKDTHFCVPKLGPEFEKFKTETRKCGISDGIVKMLFKKRQFFGSYLKTTQA